MVKSQSVLPVVAKLPDSQYCYEYFFTEDFVGGKTDEILVQGKKNEELVDSGFNIPRFSLGSFFPVRQVSSRKGIECTAAL